MTKLEELKAASDAAYDAYAVVCEAVYDAHAAAWAAERAAARDTDAANDAYQAELNKPKEQTND